MPDDTSDNIKPWTIRGIPPEERNAASEAAKRSDITLGEWLRRAIRTQIQQETQASRAPVAVGPVVSDSRTDLERIVASFRELAAAGVPISKASANRLCAALVEPLPAAKKPPPRKSDKSADQSDKVGMTSNGSQPPKPAMDEKLPALQDNT